MITYIAAEIGAGKTCFATSIAQKKIRRGKTVFTNFECANCYKISVADLITFKAPAGSLIIIDETGTEFNSRNFKTTSQQLLKYFKLSRHFKNDIILISQTFTDSDKQIRELASKVLFIRPLIKGILSMVVNVKGKIGIGLQGEIIMKYKIGKIGTFTLLPMWFKYYNTYETEDRECVRLEKYKELHPKSLGAWGASLISKITNKIKKINLRKN